MVGFTCDFAWWRPHADADHHRVSTNGSGGRGRASVADVRLSSWTWTGYADPCTRAVMVGSPGIRATADSSPRGRSSAATRRTSWSVPASTSSGGSPGQPAPRWCSAPTGAATPPSSAASSARSGALASAASARRRCWTSICRCGHRRSCDGSAGTGPGSTAGSCWTTATFSPRWAAPSSLIASSRRARERVSPRPPQTRRSASWAALSTAPSRSIARRRPRRALPLPLPQPSRCAPRRALAGHQRRRPSQSGRAGPCRESPCSPPPSVRATGSRDRRGLRAPCLARRPARRLETSGSLYCRNEPAPLH